MRPDEGDLEPILRQAQQGNVAAFNTLIELFQRQVYNVCYRTLGSREDADDAAQETFLSAFRAVHTFRGPPAGLRGWLLRVAVNACYDQLRRRQRRPADSLDALTSSDQEHGPALVDRLADPAAGPESRALGTETAAAIQRALDRLPDDQRLTVVLCDVHGLGYEEAATVLGVELGTIKSRLSRARARLRDVLAAAGELPPASRRLEQRNT